MLLRHDLSDPTRDGFTLIELVVVVLILGVIAAIAAPRMFDTATTASENSLRQSLAVVRDAIELYRATNGSYPGEAGTEADFKADLEPFLHSFPANAVRGDKVGVDVATSGNTLSFDGGSKGWLYDNTTGQFIANANGTSISGENYDEL